MSLRVLVAIGAFCVALAPGEVRADWFLTAFVGSAFGDGTFCHNVDQNTFVSPAIAEMRFVFPGDPVVLLPQRTSRFNPILDTSGQTFDDKMAVVNANQRGLQRGTGLPHLLDLARKPVFLRDNSVPSLDALLDPSRGPTAPHPFYLSTQGHRDDMVAFLRSLSTTTAGTGR